MECFIYKSLLISVEPVSQQVNTNNLFVLSVSMVIVVNKLKVYVWLVWLQYLI
jgi:hypothetical protein